MKHFTTLLSAHTCVSSLLVLAAALTASDARGVILSPAADVNTKYNDSVADASTILVKRDPDGGIDRGRANTRKGYIRYDLSGVDVSNVIDASFKLTLATDVPDDTTLYIYGLTDATTTNGNGRYGDVAWTEADAVADWSGANHVDAPANSYDSGTYIGKGDSTPPNTVAVAGFYGAYTDPTNTPLGTVALDTSQTAGTEVSISGANLLNFVTGDTNDTLTFMLFTDTLVDLYQFASSENTALSPPQLELTLRAVGVPEPTSCMLVVAGLAVLGMNRRRRRR